MRRLSGRAARPNQAAARMLDQLKTQGLAAPRADFPSAREWPLVATGKVQPEKVREYLRHAEDCDHCETLLREAILDSSDEFTTDEEKMISQLASSDPAWQKRFARALAAKSQGQGGPGSRRSLKVLRGRWMSFPKWQAWGLAAAAACVGVTREIIDLLLCWKRKR
jgi:hypothetical protein